MPISQDALDRNFVVLDGETLVRDAVQQARARGLSTWVVVRVAADDYFVIALPDLALAPPLAALRDIRANPQARAAHLVPQATTDPAEEVPQLLARYDCVVVLAGAMVAGVLWGPSDDVDTDGERWEALERGGVRFEVAPRSLGGLENSLGPPGLPGVGPDERSGSRGLDLGGVPAGPAANEVTAGTAPPAEALSPAARRYADCAFLVDDESQALTDLAPVPAGHTLRVGTPYQLSVSIRPEPVGLPAQGARKAAVEPKQTQDVAITVTATSQSFAIAEPVGTLTLPPAGDSSVAYFRVTPQTPTASAQTRACVTLRFYYEFNLIEQVTVLAEVCGEAGDDSCSQFALGQPLEVRYDHQEGDYDVDTVNTQPRAMHVDVTKEDGAYIFTFTFTNSVAHKIELSGPIRLTAADLEDKLVTLRSELLRIAMAPEYSTAVTGVDADTFAAQMNFLARLGRRLWSTLFERDEGSALYQIGLWLRAHPLPAGATVQVSVAPGAADFVFPWNLVYDGDPLPDADTPADLDRFWGLRYVVEQRVPGAGRGAYNPAPLPSGPELEVGFMLWNFDQAPAQTQLIADLLTRSKGHFAGGQPITGKNNAYAVLKDCGSQVLYFFTHGKTRLLTSAVGGFDFVQFYNQLPADWKTRLQDLYTQTQDPAFSANSSWIQLQYGSLDLDTLYAPGWVNLRKAPIVFLNMCESAQVTPAFADSFIDLFMKRGARCVIGTECAMRPAFADAFAQGFFRRLFSGDPVGQILLDVRRQFIAQNNPLGLAYTLFGQATVKFQPAPLPPVPAAAPAQGGPSHG